jgi:amphi-Trp domain-containing protein
MSDVKLERKETLSRQQAAERLSAVAEALAKGSDVEVDFGGGTMVLRVPDDVRSEFEVEVDGDEVELELELKWSTARAKAPTAAARNKR